MGWSFLPDEQLWCLRGQKKGRKEGRPQCWLWSLRGLGEWPWEASASCNTLNQFLVQWMEVTGKADEGEGSQGGILSQLAQERETLGSPGQHGRSVGR